MTDETLSSVLERLVADGVLSKRGTWFETADLSRVPEAVCRQVQTVQHLTRRDKTPITRLKFRRRRRVAL